MIPRRGKTSFLFDLSETCFFVLYFSFLAFLLLSF